MWVVPILLVIPNIVLDITEPHYSLPARLTNLFLPLGVYLLLTSWNRQVGRTVVLMVPIMIFCAFQIVLLFLYGESIIAIDMFLNVMTTNTKEASELLRNLVLAIVLVVVLYLPPIVVGSVIWIRGAGTKHPQRVRGRIAGIVLAAVGLMTMVIAMGHSAGYRITRQLFPVNVVSNMVESVHRTIRTADYFKTSEHFTFDAHSSRPEHMPEVYVLVIGETSRADNWQLFGYDRPTNPRLSQRSNLIVFPKALSESNTTHKSVPLLLTPLSSFEFGDSIYTTHSVMDAFNESGYATAWISHQGRNRSFIEFFASQAQSVDFIDDDQQLHTDMDLATHLRDYLAGTTRDKVFVVLHTYGSHFNYHERYPAEYAHFVPDNSTEAKSANRDQLINAYDNTIRYTDAVLDSIINVLDHSGRPAAMLYLSDHGEDIFDDSRGRCLHASPTPTYWQIHVPMLMWMSDSYRQAFPGAYEQAWKNKDLNVSSSAATFHTLVNLAGIHTPYLDTTGALSSADYREPRRVYLNDYNEGVELTSSGLRPIDISSLKSKNISRD